MTQFLCEIKSQLIELAKQCAHTIENEFDLRSHPAVDGIYFSVWSSKQKFKNSVGSMTLIEYRFEFLLEFLRIHSREKFFGISRPVIALHYGDPEFLVKLRAILYSQKPIS